MMCCIQFIYHKEKFEASAVAINSFDQSQRSWHMAQLVGFFETWFFPRLFHSDRVLAGATLLP